jgi:hypothetical protein
MAPPQFLLDALTDSISSGTFIDTKFFAFSRREVTRRVGSPRALYCNSRILNTVSYFFTGGQQHLPRNYTSNRSASKYSQTELLKDKREISKGDSPPTQILTPSTTITGPIVISKTNLRRKMRNRWKRTAASRHRTPRTRQTRPLPPSIRPHTPRQWIQMRLKPLPGQVPVSSMVFALLISFNHRPDNNATRMGKFTIIHDIGAVTCVHSSAN